MPPFRKPFRFYTDKPVHPTRTEPETLKVLTVDISFFKTLTRVLRTQGSEDLTAEESVRRAVAYMPFIPNHYTRHRNELNSGKKRAKALIDACVTVRTTLDKYRPPHPHPKLSFAKKIEVLVALEIIARGLPLKEGEVKRFLVQKRAEHARG